MKKRIVLSLSTALLCMLAVSCGGGNSSSATKSDSSSIGSTVSSESGTQSSSEITSSSSTESSTSSIEASVSSGESSLSSAESSMSSVESSVSSVESSSEEISSPIESKVKLPRASEDELVNNTLSYWNNESTIEMVQALSNESGNPAYTFEYTDKGSSNFLAFQVMLKDESLVENQAYLLKLKINSSIAGNVTINGFSKTLVAGDNDVELKFVAGVNTRTTTAMKIIFGTADDGFIGSGLFVLSDISYETTSLHEYENANWTLAKSETENSYYYFEDAPIIKESGNDIMRERFLIKNESIYDNYDLSMTAYATTGFPNQYNTHIGMVPWYIDDDNYIVIYADWSKDERPNGMREFQITGYINGTHVGYNDIWGDNPALADAITSSNTKSTYRIETRNNSGNKIFSFYFNEKFIGSKEFATGSTTATGTAKYGIYGHGQDIVSFENIAIEEKVIEEASHVYSYAKPDGGTYKDNADGTKTLTSPDRFMSNLLVTNDESVTATEAYTVSASFTGTETYPITKEFHMGLVPWYIDDNNYIVAYCQWWSNDSTNKLREIQITGLIGGTNIGWHDFWYDQTDIDPSVAFTLSIKKEGMTFSPSINGKNVGYWFADGDYRYGYDASALTGEQTVTPKVGYYINNTVATVSDISVIK